MADRPRCRPSLRYGIASHLCHMTRCNAYVVLLRQAQELFLRYGHHHLHDRVSILTALIFRQTLAANPVPLGGQRPALTLRFILSFMRAAVIRGRLTKHISADYVHQPDISPFTSALIQLAC